MIGVTCNLLSAEKRDIGAIVKHAQENFEKQEKDEGEGYREEEKPSATRS